MSEVKRYLPSYDAIVVGAGLGGLTAATRLAKAGKDTANVSDKLQKLKNRYKSKNIL